MTKKIITLRYHRGVIDLLLVWLTIRYRLHLVPVQAKLQLGQHLGINMRNTQHMLNIPTSHLSTTSLLDHFIILTTMQGNMVDAIIFLILLFDIISFVLL